MSAVTTSLAVCTLAAWISWLVFCFALLRKHPDRAQYILKVAAIVKFWRRVS
ncbi:hypothetical protein [Kineosporia succinea]|uniref:ATP synthase F0 subunit 8 n=1 Tax=Kineosporia succinea TaxID=84632 RepID=A0ABT9NXQ2_9ACTN|nr:hypothetical protein [Kineosporia succinea]MDP9825214.1 hypothetical protein [Kineosporia succinea]